jgi:tRNA modification GTPase
VAAAHAALAAALADVRIAATGRSVDEALVAAHVRRAVDALGEVTGATIGTDLLDRIFSRHCIGK